MKPRSAERILQHLFMKNTTTIAIHYLKDRLGHLVVDSLVFAIEFSKFFTVIALR